MTARHDFIKSCAIFYEVVHGKNANPVGFGNSLNGSMPIRFIAKQLKLTSALLRGLQRHHHAGWTHSPL